MRAARQIGLNGSTASGNKAERIPMLNRVTIRVLSPILIVLFSLATVGCDDHDGSGLAERPITARLQEHLDQLHATGITGVVAELTIGDERVGLRSGVARLGSDKPVPWDARFRMGSMTKTFVAVVILQLVGEGRLRLDDSVVTWLPGVVTGEGYDPTKITVRHLLQHTSGIFNYTYFIDFSPEVFETIRFQKRDARDIVAMAMTQPPAFAPGTAWSYSNTNYLLAGMIIERVTGRDWRAEVESRIARPLGLTATFDPYDELDLPKPHATGYEQLAPGGPLVDATRAHQSFAGAAGSLITTSGELTRFLRALMRGELLAPAEMTEMMRSVPATELEGIIPGLRYGLGLMEAPGSCGAPYFSHFGDTFGFSTRDAVSVDGERAVVVSLSANVAGEAVLDVLTTNLQLLDDAMCLAP